MVHRYARKYMYHTFNFIILTKYVRMMTHVNLRLTRYQYYVIRIHVLFGEPGTPVTFVHAKMLQYPAFIMCI